MTPGNMVIAYVSIAHTPSLQQKPSAALQTVIYERPVSLSSGAMASDAVAAKALLGTSLGALLLKKTPKSTTISTSHSNAPSPPPPQAVNKSFISSLLVRLLIFKI